MAVAAAGCGGQSPDSGPAPSTTGDRARDSSLDRKIDRLRRERRRLREKSRANTGRSSGEARDLDANFEGLGGEAGVAFLSRDGQIVTAGDIQIGSAWSTIKVALILREVGDEGGIGRASAATLANSRLALTASDNAAAERIFGELKDRYGGAAAAAGEVTNLLRSAGDERTVVSAVGRDGFSPYGQTEWSLAEQVRLMAAIDGGCIASPGTRRYVLERMGEVTSDRWGLGSIDQRARWKGGWGPGEDDRYLVRQMGIVEAGGVGIPVAIAARADDGSFESGQSVLTEVARRLVPLLDRRGGSGCR